MPNSPIEKAFYEYLSSKPIINSKDIYSVIEELPEKQQEFPYLFTAYGCQKCGKNPFYKTTTSEYGWYTPNPSTVPIRYFPKSQKFSSDLARSGMYRSFSLNMK